LKHEVSAAEDVPQNNYLAQFSKVFRYIPTETVGSAAISFPIEMVCKVLQNNPNIQFVSFYNSKASFGTTLLFFCPFILPSIRFLSLHLSFNTAKGINLCFLESMEMLADALCFCKKLRHIYIEGP
jgi:hypothetical protein